MSSSTSFAAAPIMTSARSVSSLSMFAALLHKEWRESRGILLVGLVVFWIVPAIWEGLYAAFDGHHEVISGFAVLLLLMVGWLFAIVVSAVVVCRDWGRPEEHFLLSRPVSRYAVIAAKLLAGAMVVLLVFVVAAAWDLALWGVASSMQSRISRFEVVINVLPTAIPVACALTISYLLAFSLAVLTRQTLPSILFVILVLLTWATAPLLSSRFNFLHPAWMDETNTAAKMSPEILRNGWNSSGLQFFFSVMTGYPFLATVGVCILASLALTVWACRHEQVIRIGHKPLAWTVAIVVIVLFLAAMNEVGNSLVVRDQTVFRQLGSDPKVSEWNEEWTIAARDGQGYAIPSLDYGWNLLASFRLDKAGRIQNLQYATFAQSDAPDTLPLLRRPSTLEIDSSGRLVVTGVLVQRPEETWITTTSGRRTTGRRELREQPEVMGRAWIIWPEGEQPRVISKVIVPPPSSSDQRPRILTDCAATETHAYIVYCSIPDFTPDGPFTRPREWPRSLYVYEWSKEPNHAPSLVLGPIALHGRADRMLDPVSAAGDDVPETLRPPKDIIWTCASFNANSKEPIPSDMKYLCEHWYRTRDMSPAIRNELQALAEEDRSMGPYWGYTATTYDPARQLGYVADGNSLLICRRNAEGRWKTIGRYRGSPLARMMQRDTLGLFRLGDSHLVLQTSASLSVYDVSNPEHPRRAGFFSTLSSDRYRTQVFPASPYILLREGTMLSVLDPRKQ